MTVFIFILTLFGFKLTDYTRVVKLMGSRFDITVSASSEKKANFYIDSAISEIQRIEKLISSWDINSQTSKINSMAGIRPVLVDQELFDLIQRALMISKLTDGAFDISYASMDRIWKFDGTMKTMPSEKEIKKSVTKVGYQHILLDQKTKTVFLQNKGMKIGFGAIGKGYAADKAKAKLMGLGVESGIINASGDMSTWGNQSNGKPWSVAITNPMNKEKVFGLIKASNNAIVTSGNYEKFVMFNGIRYSHIIDPRSGYPSKGILSVTIIAPKAEIADALATSVFVMGIETGLNRINQMPNVECIIIDDYGKMHTSNHMEIQSL